MCSATRMARLTLYLIDTFGTTQAMGFLRQVISSSRTPQVPISLVHQTYARFVDYVEPLAGQGPALTFNEIVASSPTHTKRETAMRAWEERLDLVRTGRGKMVFVNGKGVERDEVSARCQPCIIRCDDNLLTTGR